MFQLWVRYSQPQPPPPHPHHARPLLGGKCVVFSLSLTRTHSPLARSLSLSTDQRREKHVAIPHDDFAPYKAATSGVAGKADSRRAFQYVVATGLGVTTIAAAKVIVTDFLDSMSTSVCPPPPPPPPSPLPFPPPTPPPTPPSTPTPTPTPATATVERNQRSRTYTSPAWRFKRLTFAYE
jgi:hypothetical protein